MADQDAVADVFCDAWWHSFREQARKIGRTRDDVRARGRRILLETPDGWGAEVDGELVGFCCYHPDRQEIVHMAVLPRQMGSGAAEQLLEHAERDLGGRGNFAYLWLWDGNRRAQMFYANHGWQWTGRDRSRPLDGPLGRLARRELHLAKPLTPLAQSAWPDVQAKPR